MALWQDGGELRRTILVAMRQAEVDCGVAMLQEQSSQGDSRWPDKDRVVFGDFSLFAKGDGYLIFKGDVPMASASGIKFRFVRTEADNPKQIMQVEGNALRKQFRIISATPANRWDFFIFRENNLMPLKKIDVPDHAVGRSAAYYGQWNSGITLNITGSFVLSMVNHGNLIKSNYGGNLDLVFTFISNCFNSIQQISNFNTVRYFKKFSENNCSQAEVIDVLFWLLMVGQKNKYVSELLDKIAIENAAPFSEYLHQLLAFGSGFQFPDNVKIFESLLERLSALPKGCFRWVVFYSQTWRNQIKLSDPKRDVDALVLILHDCPQVLMDGQVSGKVIDYMCSNLPLERLLVQLHEVGQKSQIYRKLIEGAALKYLFSKKWNIDKKKLILSSDFIQQFSELPELNLEELGDMMDIFYNENPVSAVLQLAALSPAYLVPLIDHKVFEIVTKLLASIEDSSDEKLFADISLQSTGLSLFPLTETLVLQRLDDYRAKVSQVTPDINGDQSTIEETLATVYVAAPRKESSRLGISGGDVNHGRWVIPKGDLRPIGELQGGFAIYMGTVPIPTQLGSKFKFVTSKATNFSDTILSTTGWKLGTRASGAPNARRITSASRS